VNNYQVLLYYKYGHLEDAKKTSDEQRLWCQELNLKGRIIVAEEGINGTLEGLTQDTEEYIRRMRSSPCFADINFKRSEGGGEAFSKLSVKVRPEIVASRLAIDPTKTSGKYITADELHEWFITGQEFTIVDMRNDYEQASGYFENSVLSDIHNFYDLPGLLPRIDHLKTKTVVTVCTGGVRCETASGFLIKNGFSKVYQLQDGIVTYMEKYPNEHFKGKLYVFDNRLTLAFNTEDPKHTIVGKCFHCGVAADTYVNCEYDVCHYHYICCRSCREQGTNLAFCKIECKNKYYTLQQPPAKIIYTAAS